MTSKNNKIPVESERGKERRVNGTKAAGWRR